MTCFDSPDKSRFWQVFSQALPLFPVVPISLWTDSKDSVPLVSLSESDLGRVSLVGGQARGT